MKINSKMVIITIIFGTIFIFVPMGKIPVTYYELENCGGICDVMPKVTGTHRGYLRLFGFPYQWTPKILPLDSYSDYKKVETLSYKSIIIDGLAGMAFGVVVGFILFRKRKK
jgi:hypothetical protein